MSIYVMSAVYLNKIFNLLWTCYIHHKVRNKKWDWLRNGKYELHLHCYILHDLYYLLETENVYNIMKYMYVYNLKNFDEDCQQPTRQWIVNVAVVQCFITREIYYNWLYLNLLKFKVST